MAEFVYPQTGNALVYYIIALDYSGLIGNSPVGWRQYRAFSLDYMGTMIALPAGGLCLQSPHHHQVLLVGIFVHSMGRTHFGRIEILKVSDRLPRISGLPMNGLRSLRNRATGNQYKRQRYVLSWCSTNDRPLDRSPAVPGDRKVRN
jgi:hypothetical protein